MRCYSTVLQSSTVFTQIKAISHLFFTFLTLYYTVTSYWLGLSTFKNLMMLLSQWSRCQWTIDMAHAALINTVQIDNWFTGVYWPKVNCFSINYEVVVQVCSLHNITLHSGHISMNIKHVRSESKSRTKHSCPKLVLKSSNLESCPKWNLRAAKIFLWPFPLANRRYFTALLYCTDREDCH